MPENLPADEPCCRGCGKTLRRRQQFCPHCGLRWDAVADRSGAKLDAPPVPTDRAKGADWRWLELKQVGWLFAILLGSSFLAGIIGRVDPSPRTETIAAAFDALVVLMFAVFRFRQLASLFKFPRLDRHTTIVLMLLAVTFVAAMSAYFKIIEWAGVPILRIANVYEKAGWPLVSMLFMVSVLPAVVEEVAFRGVIQTTLERVVGAREALFIQAALFSVLHLLPLMFVSHFLMGLCFGYLRLRSRSLYPGMALHASWNALVLLQELQYL